MEFEIVWDGVNRGDGSDLLCIPPMPPRSGVTGTTSKRVVLIADLLPIAKENAITTTEIMARSGATYSTVSQTLFRLRQRGLLRWDLVQGPVGKGQRPRVYWRRQKDTAA